MIRECPQCGFELREMSWSERYAWEKLDKFSIRHPYELHGTVEGFDVWLEAEVGDTYQVSGLGSVTLVEAQVDYEFEDSSTMVYVVLKVDEHRHYIVKGTRDSYGNASWDPLEFRAVTQQTRTAWIWDENF